MVSMAKARGHWPVSVGDEVWVSSGSRTWSWGKVEKIGTKLIHIREGSWRVSAFYLADGQRRDGYPGCFQTKAQHEELERRSGLLTKLREDYGIEVATWKRKVWTTDALQALLNAAEAATTLYPYEDED